MPCDKCNGYWICDPNSADPCMEGGGFESFTPDQWKDVGTQDVSPAGRYHIWSRPGFEATISNTQPGGPPEWSDAGEIDLEEATYRLWARPEPGGGSFFQVKVEKEG